MQILHFYFFLYNLKAKIFELPKNNFPREIKFIHVDIKKGLKKLNFLSNLKKLLVKC